MSDEIYRKLAKVLDTLPNGFPASESGVVVVAGSIDCSAGRDSAAIVVVAAAIVAEAAWRGAPVGVAGCHLLEIRRAHPKQLGHRLFAGRSPTHDPRGILFQASLGRPARNSKILMRDDFIGAGNRLKTKQLELESSAGGVAKRVGDDAQGVGKS